MVEENVKTLTVNNYKISDFNELLRLQRLAFPLPYPEEQLWNIDQIRSHVTTFPEGAIAIWDGNEIVGSTTLIKKNGLCLDQSWEEASGNGYIDEVHVEDGDYLYGIDICSNPFRKGEGIARKLVEESIKLSRDLGLRGVIEGSRIPGYIQYKDVLDVHAYIDKVIKGELNDPTFSFFLKFNPKILKIKEDYLNDPESMNYGVLILLK